MNAKLTAKETALMTAVANREFSFFDDGISEGSGIWADCLTGEIVGSTKYPVSETRRGVASVLNSLCRKGLLQSEDDADSDEGAWTYLTAAGVEWCEALTAPAVVEAPVETVEERLTAIIAVVEETTPADCMGGFVKGDLVLTKDGREWMVEGPAQNNTTIKLTLVIDSQRNVKAPTTFRFARNLTKA